MGSTASTARTDRSVALIADSSISSCLSVNIARACSILLRCRRLRRMIRATKPNAIMPTGTVVPATIALVRDEEPDDSGDCVDARVGARVELVGFEVASLEVLPKSIFGSVADDDNVVFEVEGEGMDMEELELGGPEPDVAGESSLVEGEMGMAEVASVPSLVLMLEVEEEFESDEEIDDGSDSVAAGIESTWL